MVDKKKTPDQEFDEDFDVSEFDDTTLDDFEEFADLPADDENFDEEGWEAEEAQTTEKTKKSKKAASGEKKSLSFNTMAIIGALVIGGGIMVFNVMNASSKKQTDGSASQPYQSGINLGGVMDGTLFGQNKGGEGSTPDQGAASGDQQGFLENPTDLGSGNPPQPTPIAPSEKEALTAMPAPVPTPPADQVVAEENPAPVAPPVSDEQAGEAPMPTTAPQDQAAPAKAEDILKKAMESREQKLSQADDETAAEEPALAASNPPENPGTPTAPITEPQTDEAQNAAAPTPVMEQNPVDSQVLSRLEQKIESLSSRLDQMEGEIGSVKDAKSSDTQDLQEVVASLKKEIQDLKDRPAAPTIKQAVSESKASEQKEASVDSPVPTTPKIKKSEPKPKAATATASKQGAWELRAAQPGRAWVSKSGSRDVQSIEVGQALEGLGRISAITYQNGRWTVYGTLGQIRQ